MRLDRRPHDGVGEPTGLGQLVSRPAGIHQRIGEFGHPRNPAELGEDLQQVRPDTQQLRRASPVGAGLVQRGRDGGRGEAETIGHRGRRRPVRVGGGLGDGVGGGGVGGGGGCCVAVSGLARCVLAEPEQRPHRVGPRPRPTPPSPRRHQQRRELVEIRTPRLGERLDLR